MDSWGVRLTWIDCIIITEKTIHAENIKTNYNGIKLKN